MDQRSKNEKAIRDLDQISDPSSIWTIETPERRNQEKAKII